MSIARRLRARTAVHLDWRCGQVWSTNGATSTIRLVADAGFIRNKTVATSLLPTGAIVGDAVVCRVYGKGADDYNITEIHPSVFIDSPGTDQDACVGRGIFSPGCVTPDEAKGIWDDYQD